MVAFLSIIPIEALCGLGIVVIILFFAFLKSRKVSSQKFSNTEERKTFQVSQQPLQKELQPQKQTIVVKTKKEFTADTAFFAACLKCNPYEPCSKGEEEFCQRIIKKSLAEPYFVGQFWIDAQGHAYRPDFVVNPYGLPRMAIELDGFSYHCEGEISRAQFNVQLDRQNRLLAMGWQILRFSYDQMRCAPEQCINLINQFVQTIPPEQLKKLPNKHCVYMEYNYVTKEMGKEFEEQYRAVYSAYRNVWHFPFGCTDEQYTALCQKRKPRIWTYCPYCKHEAVQRVQNKTGIPFWSCQNQECNKTFNDSTR